MPDRLTFYEYERLAIQTASGPSVEDTDAALLATTLGLNGEAGEFADIVKKCLFQGKLLNEETKTKLRDELGDILWYASLGAYALETTLDQVARDNIEKLRERYPDGFDAEKSEARYNDSSFRELHG